MGALWSSIRHWAFPDTVTYYNLETLAAGAKSSHSESDVQSETDSKLNEWKVETLASNRYLYTIPSQRVAAKRTEIEAAVRNGAHVTS